MARIACARADPGLQQLARQAGIVFTGTVDRIEAVPPAAPSDIGVVRVTFRVSDALRGTTPGASLTICEWAGLWTSGDRYRVGENLLLFLYAPSGGLGLTTTAEGARGRISLGDSPISGGQTVSFTLHTLGSGGSHQSKKPIQLRRPQFSE